MITKQQVEGLIERLADKTISNGCLISCIDVYDELASYSLPAEKRVLPISECKPKIIPVIGDDFFYDREHIHVSDELINDLHGIFYYGRFKNIGHPITIGIVLEKIIPKYQAYYLYSTDANYGYTEELIQLWQPLGLSRSLQEIIEESGWEYTLTARDEDSSIRKVEVLTSPEANALCEYLLSLFPVDEEICLGCRLEKCRCGETFNDLDEAFERVQ